MRQTKNLLAAVLGVLVMASIAGYYWSRDTSAGRTRGNPAASVELPSIIDEKLLQTARQMSASADTNDEQDLAREALRLSDHELDQAFATALREAETVDAQSAASAGSAVQQLASRVTRGKAKVAADQDQVAQLTKLAATKADAADRLELAKAQLALDQDDLDDATQDLAREGGDRHDRLERALQEHEAAQQGAAPLPRLGALPPVATLKEQVESWLSLESEDRGLLAASQQAAANASSLEREHNGLESKTTAAADTNSDDSEDTAAVVARLRKLSDQKKTMMELDKRIQDSQQLAEVYKRWSALVEIRERGALHLLLRSLVAIFAILLAAVLVNIAILHAVRNRDRPTQHRVQVIASISSQLVAAAVILLIIFGPPTQLSTMIGLATAGLTVVLKDFIVGFIGWFVLMGRNGVRIGDWVEINGVGGEVIEIGVLKTVLLEMGNWTSTGHPTGRRVSFSNSFAIEGHYFNFSTVGQWLWDELQVTLPSGGEPYRVAEQIRQTVERETDADAAEAAADWERVTHQYGVSTFSARPAVDLRPSGDSLTVIVRYITRAPRRYEVKSHLFQVIVELLHGAAQV